MRSSRLCNKLLRKRKRERERERERRREREGERANQSKTPDRKQRNVCESLLSKTK